MLRRWREKARDGLSSWEAQQRLAKLEQAVQVQLLDRHQAEVNNREGETVANLVKALEGVPSACITLGSLAILKYPVNGEPVFHARQLSAREMKALERFPDLHKDPEKFFQSLSDAIALPPDPPDALPPTDPPEWVPEDP